MARHIHTQHKRKIKHLVKKTNEKRMEYNELLRILYQLRDEFYQKNPVYSEIVQQIKITERKRDQAILDILDKPVKNKRKRKIRSIVRRK